MGKNKRKNRFNEWWDDLFGESMWEKKKGHAISGFWTDRFGGSDYWTSTRDQKLFEEALRTVARTVNVTARSTREGKLRNLEVRWSDGKATNEIANDTVYLSPNIVSEELTVRKAWSKDELTDALVGDALTESAFKYEASANAEFIASQQWAGRKMTRELWHTAEILAAQASVIDNYPGFMPYFAASRAYHTSPDAFAMLQTALNAFPPDTAIAEKVLEWQMLHPNEPLEIPADKYEGQIEKAAERMAEAKTSEERAEFSKQVLESFARKWPIPPSPSASQRGVGDPNAPPSMPDLTDMGATSAPGKPVENTCDPNLGYASPHDKRVGSPESRGIVLGDKPPNGTLDVRVKSNPSRVQAYKRLSIETARLSNALAQKLRMRNEDRKEYERGLRNGELDSGAIYKIALKQYDDELLVFERQDIINIPDTAIALLIDESGSMASSGLSPAARKLSVILANALKHIQGVHLAVLGHTGEGSCQDDLNAPGLALHHYYTPQTNAIETLSAIRAFNQNLDGYAIQRAAEYALLWWPLIRSKVLIHISDGIPSAGSYGGSAAHMHVRKVSETCATKGIKVIGILLEPEGTPNQQTIAYTRPAMNQMYGPKNWVLITKPEDSITVVANIITRTLKSMCFAES